MTLAADDRLARLRFLLETVRLEAEHLAATDVRLFAVPMSAERAGTLRADVDLAERVDAFVARFARLQDTLGDKLLPEVLRQSAEPVGSAIDNLNRAERLGWLRSVDSWLQLRRLRNEMIHEYVRDPLRLAAALTAGHHGVPELAAFATALTAYADSRFPAAESN